MHPGSPSICLQVLSDFSLFRVLQKLILNELLQICVAPMSSTVEMESAFISL